MPYVNVSRGKYVVTTDPKKVDVDAARAFLSRTGKSWARGISRRVLARAIRHSLCFALLERGKQIGFARVVTDRATYAYLCDVYILEPYQARGLGAWMIKVVMGHADLQGLRRFQLVTRDAHGLYRRFGFRLVKHPKYHMEIFRPGLYLEVKDGSKTST